jgi:Dullard-like phosphatase family protein
MTYENYIWYEKLYNIVKNELSMNLTKDDLDEHHIIQIIHHNVKTIGNYFKIIIDNLYSETYHPNIKQYKFPSTLNNIIDKEKNKNEIISSFFFDAYAYTDNYTIEDIDRFFNLFLYKVNDPNSSYILSYRVKFPDEGSPIFISNNQNLLNQKPLFFLPKMNTRLYKFTLVLDLDETLVFIKKDNNNNRVLILRPYLFEFLEKMKYLYELVLFSFGTPEYVDPILNIIEKNTKYFEYKLYRQHASLNGDDYVKDLNKLGRDLKKVVIIDNLPQAFKLQKSNGICIKPFYGDSIGDRNTLKFLSEVLERIRYDAEETNDIRESIKKESHFIITRITSNVDY